MLTRIARAALTAGLVYSVYKAGENSAWATIGRSNAAQFACSLLGVQPPKEKEG